MRTCRALLPTRLLPHRRAQRSRAASAAASSMPPPGPAAAPSQLLQRRLVDAFVAPYLAENPTAARALRTLQQLPGSPHIHYDHIAFRSFGVAGLGIDAAARAWTDLGYQRRDALTFPAKKLRAYWCVTVAAWRAQPARPVRCLALSFAGTC